MSFAIERAVDIDDRLHIRLCRPEVRNAIDLDMVEALHEIAAELERKPRILIISGADGVFASGADIRQLRDRRRDDALAGINSQIFDRIAKLPMPVIAAVDGWALGGGGELAYAADFRLASSTARFGNPEVSLGIAAAAGAAWRLVEIVGEPLAKEILLAGRVLDADEAFAARLVTSVHPSEELEAAAYSLTDRIAKQDPLALRLTKSLLRMPRDAHPLVDGITQAVLFESPAKQERMTAFLERRVKS